MKEPRHGLPPCDHDECPPTRCVRLAGGSSPSSCSVVPTSRSVIEGKLLDALSNDGCVAILASEEDLNVMIAALEYAMLGNRKQTVAARALAIGMRQLRKEAFPPNDQALPTASTKL